jgi:hypothetical protein
MLEGTAGGGRRRQMTDEQVGSLTNRIGQMGDRGGSWSMWFRTTTKRLMVGRTIQS